MGTTYNEAPAIHGLAMDVMRQYHPKLADAGVTAHVLLASNEDEDGFNQPALKRGGYPIAAKVQITSLVDRARGIADVKLVVDEYAWDQLPDASRLALLDHELEHVLLAIDNKTGLLKRDDLGRPKLKIQPHDFEVGVFVSVAERHREAAVEVRELRRFRSEQMELFG
jgi:hypothetical protein